MCSRRALYAAGLPLGECVTRARLGGGYVCGGGGGGSSSSSQASTTENTDARVIGGDSSTNISAANSNITVTDAGAVHAAFGAVQNITSNAMDAVSNANKQALAAVAQSEQQVSDAYSTAKAGEQKVLVAAVFGIIGVVAFAAVKKG